VFFDLLRDRASINAILADVAGEAIAKANIAEKAKTQKQIIRDYLAGANGRVKIDGWLPGWLAFPVRMIGQDIPQATEPERMAAE
jgi:ParB family chromosome partitioning protein